MTVLWYMALYLEEKEKSALAVNWHEQIEQCLSMKDPYRSIGGWLEAVMAG